MAWDCRHWRRHNGTEIMAMTALKSWHRRETRREGGVGLVLREGSVGLVVRVLRMQVLDVCGEMFKVAAHAHEV